MYALSKDPEGEQALNSTAAAMTTQTAVKKETGSRDEANGNDRTVEQLLLKIKQLESEILLLKVILLLNIIKTTILLIIIIAGRGLK